MNHWLNDIFSDPLFCQDPMLKNLCVAFGFDQKTIEQYIMNSTKTPEAALSNLNLISDEKAPNQQCNELLEHLHQLANEHIEPLIVSRCSVKVIASFGHDTSKTVKCILDTGAESNIMTHDIAKELGLQDYIDTKYVGKIHGIGAGNIIGYIPYVVFNIGSIELKSNFLILDNSVSNPNKEKKSGIKCVLLGMPFMMFYGIELNFKQSVLTISDQVVKMIIEDH